MFDNALTDADISTAQAADLMGVSESMVSRMRSPNYRDSVSLIQLFKCGPVVLWFFHKRLHARCGMGKRALGELLETVSLVGVGIE